MKKIVLFVIASISGICCHDRTSISIQRDHPDTTQQSIVTVRRKVAYLVDARLPDSLSKVTEILRDRVNGKLYCTIPPEDQGSFALDENVYVRIKLKSHINDVEVLHHTNFVDTKGVALLTGFVYYESSENLEN